MSGNRVSDCYCLFHQLCFQGKMLCLTVTVVEHFYIMYYGSENVLTMCVHQSVC